MACMKWLPPMLKASPSPVMTHTESSGRAALDRVEAVGVHVVGEAAGAADAGDEDDLLARDAEFRHHLLHVVEDRVVAAARTPAHLLIRREVGLRELARRRGRFARDDRTRLALRRRPAPRHVPP